MQKTLLTFAIIAFALGRFLITPRLNLPTAEGSYEAFAHLFVGGLFGAWLKSKDQRAVYFNWYQSRDKFLWWSFWGLSALELVMFLIQKKLAG
jgi:hypothetical protein